MIVSINRVFMRGHWGVALTPWLMILSSAHKNNAALIAHEQCHQQQQRDYGTLRFWWRYFTDPYWRQLYEVEAYKVWIKTNPDDTYRVITWLARDYGLNLSIDESVALLTE